MPLTRKEKKQRKQTQKQKQRQRQRKQTQKQKQRQRQRQKLRRTRKFVGGGYERNYSMLSQLQDEKKIIPMIKKFFESAVRDPATNEIIQNEEETNILSDNILSDKQQFEIAVDNRKNKIKDIIETEENKPVNDLEVLIYCLVKLSKYFDVDPRSHPLAVVSEANLESSQNLVKIPDVEKILRVYGLYKYFFEEVDRAIQFKNKEQSRVENQQVEMQNLGNENGGRYGPGPEGKKPDTPEWRRSVEELESIKNSPIHANINEVLLSFMQEYSKVLYEFVNGVNGNKVQVKLDWIEGKKINKKYLEELEKNHIIFRRKSFFPFSLR
tara:strand:+ start:611 stop:1585 length:975 start_codon:yes stop_codon:yes gene_type:complete